MVLLPPLSVEFLNDNVIEFYLKFIRDKLTASSHSDKIFFFNRYRTLLSPSFFYKKLQKGYEGVQRWTKQTNIFEKDLLIIPINEQ